MIAVTVSHPQRIRVAAEVAVGALGQPQHHVFVIAGVAGAGTRPGQLLGTDPALRAVQPADLIDQPQPMPAQVQVSPAASPPVIDRPAEDPARALQSAGPWADRDFNIAVSAGYIGHRRGGDLQEAGYYNTVWPHARPLRG